MEISDICICDKSLFYRYINFVVVFILKCYNNSSIMKLNDITI